MKFGIKFPNFDQILGIDSQILKISNKSEDIKVAIFAYKVYTQFSSFKSCTLENSFVLFVTNVKFKDLA